jgi:hypothetical protein
MISLPAKMKSLAQWGAQADRVEESLRGYTEVSAQTPAPLDRHLIEPVVIEDFV